MSDSDLKFMSIALGIAFSRLGKTSPNPSVGAVIVKNGEIVSTGGTSEYGADHAEIVALKNAGKEAEGAHMYVTLEPCCHKGKKTPPCTEAIIKAGISRVYVPINDPNPEVTCNGIQRLQDAGVETVMMDEMKDKAFDLIRQFEKYIVKKKPFIIHKSAMTLDGRIAAPGGDSRWISSEYSRYIVHRLRAVVDAVVIGKNTLEKDNPMLNVRLDSFSDEVKDYFRNNDFVLSGSDNFFIKMLLGSDEPVRKHSPLRVIAGLPEKISESLNLLFDDNYLFIAGPGEEKKLADRTLKKMDDSGKIVFAKGKKRHDQVEDVLNELYSRGRMFVLLEGGGKTAGSFFDAGAIDQFFYFLSPRILGGGVSPVAGHGRESVAASLSLKDVSSVMLKEDILVNGYSTESLIKS